MVTQMNPSVRRKALRTFRQRGVVVHVGALERLFAAYETLDGLDFPAFLDSVFDLLGRSDGVTNGILTLEAADSIALKLQREEDRRGGLSTACIEVIDAFKVPEWEPAAMISSNAISSAKRINGPGRPVIDALPQDKANMFRRRYELMRAKTLRNEQFTPPSSGLLSLAKQSPYFRLTGIESLAGSKEDKLVLGMLTQLEEGTWYLEDLNGNVRVDLSHASVTAGLHTECSFVIAQGRLIEEEGQEPYFQISAMGTPPLERREASLNALSRSPNLFGGTLNVSESDSLLKMEKEAVDTIFLLLSDVALDNSKVFAGLRHIFEGYIADDVLPKLIVLMGNFLSHPFGQDVNDVMMLAEKFTELGTMIASDFAALAETCTFVIVPGTNDPGPGNILPRPPMPRTVLKGFIEAIGEERVHLASNPCRIRYMTQEFVILRDDLMQKMVRHCAVKPDFGESGLMSEHFVKSVVDQANLCPLPTSARPILWRHSHAMWLFPLPHTIILADRVDGYICKYGGALGLNPGSFATDFSFQIYIPAERRAQQCSLDSETIRADEERASANEEPKGTSEVTDESIEEAPESNAKEDIEMQESDADSADENLSLSDQPPEGRYNERQPDIAAASLESDDNPSENNLGKETKDHDIDEQGNSLSDEESDDDSYLVPDDNIERRDIKSLVRQSMVEDNSLQTERAADSESLQAEHDQDEEDS